MRQWIVVESLRRKCPIRLVVAHPNLFQWLPLRLGSIELSRQVHHKVVNGCRVDQIGWDHEAYPICTVKIVLDFADCSPTFSDCRLRRSIDRIDLRADTTVNERVHRQCYALECHRIDDDSAHFSELRSDDTCDNS